VFFQWHRVSTTPNPSEHRNFAGIDSRKTPYFLSVVLERDDNEQAAKCRAILWHNEVTIAWYTVLFDSSFYTLGYQAPAPDSGSTEL